MEVRIDNPELERALSDLAQKSGRAADDVVEDALAGYFEKLEELRGALDARYDELKAGRVQLIDGEKAFNALKVRAKSGATARERLRATPHVFIDLEESADSCRNAP